MLVFRSLALQEKVHRGFLIGVLSFGRYVQCSDLLVVKNGLVARLYSHFEALSAQADNVKGLLHLSLRLLDGVEYRLLIQLSALVVTF